MKSLDWIRLKSISFNPRAPGGARYGYGCNVPVVKSVSIHAPPEGRDDRIANALGRSVSVSIHAPPEGRDAADAGRIALDHTFQSTRPRRGAIHDGIDGAALFLVSIHAPPEGRDRIMT